jgi:hypothetical protein
VANIAIRGGGPGLVNAVVGPGAKWYFPFHVGLEVGDELFHAVRSGEPFVTKFGEDFLLESGWLARIPIPVLSKLATTLATTTEELCCITAVGSAISRGLYHLPGLAFNALLRAVFGGGADPKACNTDGSTAK